MSITLLLVEDDGRQIEAIRLLFEESWSDTTVLVARTLAEARSFERENVDAVLLDLELPDSGGLATVAAIVDRFAPVPIIVLTATNDASMAREALALGADDYLEKALIPPAAIQRVVRYALRHSRQRVEAAERDARSSAVAQLGQLALGETPTDALRGILCEVVAHVLHAPGVMVLERTAEGFLAARSAFGCSIERRAPIPADGRGPIAEAVRTNRAVSVDDVRAHADPAVASPFADLGAVSLAAVPVRTRQNVPEGALVVWRSEALPFGAQETAFLDAAANVLASAMQRNAMQEALRRNQHEMERILDAVPECILRFDENLCVQYLNHAAAQAMPIVRVGMSIDAIALSPRHRSRWRGVLERALASGVPERFDAEGMTGPYRFDVSVVPLPEAESGSVLVVLRDITERVRAQQRYETLFASNVVGVFFCNSDGVITQANRAFLEMVGHEEVALAERPLALRDVMAPDAHAVHAARLREIRKHGVLPPLPAGLVHRRGQTVPVLLASAVVQQTPEEIVTFVVDETATRRVELEMRNQTLLLDSARDAIMLCDMDGVIRFWNEGARRLYGWTREEAVGKRKAELVGTPGDTTTPAIDASFLECGGWQGELHQQTRAGAQIVVDSSCSLIPPSLGEPPMMLIINTDVTEKKSLERQLLHAQRIEILGTLAGGIAHDLNNILMPVLMGAESLRRLALPPAANQVVERIAASSRRGTEIIRQLLTFARRPSGENEMADPKRIVAEAQRMLRETTPLAVAIETEIDPEVWTIACDATQLLQILLNLGLNARDAMPDGGTLTIHAENVDVDEHYASICGGPKPGAYVLLLVSDTGSGIAPESLDRIFEPFFTTKAAGAGTGLGLATTRSIVRNHGGAIKVYSEPGMTVFKVYLPAALEGGAVDREEEPAPLARADGELVLVIDDETAIRDVTAATLRSFGYRVLVAADGREGLALYAQHADVAVVLTDMLMPALDGRTTIAALRQLDPRVRIIGMSGYTRQRAIDAAAPDLLLQKPFRAADLLHAIRSMLIDAGR